MSSPPVRSYLVIAAAIVIAGVLISASLFLAIGEAPTTKTILETATTTSLATSTLTLNTTVTTTTATAESFIWLTDSAICTGQGGYEPCWGLPPYVFQCTSQSLLAGPAPEVCTQKVTSTLSPYPSYNITITIPQGNGPSWANCGWVVQGTTDQGVGYCVPLSGTTFIVGMPFSPTPVGSQHAVP